MRFKRKRKITNAKIYEDRRDLYCMNNLGKFFPPWTVPREFWQTALRPDVSGVAVDVWLFHESGCRMAHKYLVYRDLFPHPALQGQVMNKLLALVARAMAIAHLTHLHITISASASRVLEECFLSVPFPWVSAVPRPVSFASEVTALDASPDSDHLPDLVPVDLPDIQIHDPVYPRVPEENPMAVSTKVSELNVPLPPPPPVSSPLYGRRLLGDQAATPLCLTFRRNYRGGSRWGL